MTNAQFGGSGVVIGDPSNGLPIGRAYVVQENPPPKGNIFQEIDITTGKKIGGVMSAAQAQGSKVQILTQAEVDKQRLVWSTEIIISATLGGYLFGPIGAIVGATGIAGYLYRKYKS